MPRASLLPSSLPFSSHVGHRHAYYTDSLSKTAVGPLLFLPPMHRRSTTQRLPFFIPSSPPPLQSPTSTLYLPQFPNTPMTNHQQGFLAPSFSTSSSSSLPPSPSSLTTKKPTSLNPIPLPEDIGVAVTLVEMLQQRYQRHPPHNNNNNISIARLLPPPPPPPIQTPTLPPTQIDGESSFVPK